MSDLPEGWAQTQLTNVIGSDGVFSDGDWVESKDQDPAGDVRLIQLADVGDGRYRDRSARFLTKKRATELGCTFLEPGDILVARMPAPIGRACIFPGDPKPSVTAVDVCIIRPGSGGVLPLWLLHTINAPQFRASLEEFERGTTRKRISRTNLGRLELPVPPLAEQHRIVTKVAEVLGDINTSGERLGKASNLLKRFRQSVLAAACSGRLTEDWRRRHPNIEPAESIVSKIGEATQRAGLRQPRNGSRHDETGFSFEVPKSWVVCHVDNLAAPRLHAIKAGPFGSALTKASYVPKGYKVYGQEQVISGNPNFGDYYIDDKKFHELKSCAVSAGDILISLVGTAGKVLIIPEKFQPGIINPRLVKLSLHQSIERRYIASYLLSPAAKEFFARRSHGGTMEILNLAMLRTLPIPLPPLREQHEIVRRVDSLFAIADTIEGQVAAAAARVRKAPQSVLAKAFRGELVPIEAELARQQGRSYEPASVLLERIHQRRTDESIGVRRRRQKE